MNELTELNELFEKVKTVEDSKRGWGSKLIGATSSTALHPFLFNLIKNNCIKPDDESIYSFVNKYIADNSDNHDKSDLIIKIISYNCADNDKNKLEKIRHDLLFQGGSRKRKHKRKFTRRKRKSRLFNTGISYR